MKSKTTPEYRALLVALPEAIQLTVKKQYKIWSRNPFHASLHFKLIKDDLWSVRITQKYRALGLRNTDEITWFWIGSHTEYDRLIR